MVGRIREESIAEVREKARIDEIVSGYVSLRNAGGGSMKGLCPFHDEKSPSFQVTPSRGLFYCFGCQAGGDVIKFLMDIDGLSFGESVERLADKFGVDLKRDEDGTGRDDRPKGPQRRRLIEANAAAQSYLRRAAHPPAGARRPAVPQRARFRPVGGGHLRARVRPPRRRGPVQAPAGEGVQPGGAGRGRTGRVGPLGLRPVPGRLLWPIREGSGDVLGFGARRIFDDDKIEAKYLNTPETPVYKKSQVLYGIDLARREMARSSQAVVVEGYTDVMACHLAGVGTAVATCGTSFTEEHSRVLRRFLHDHDEFRGEVIFTFDSDTAGQNAALKAFAGDSKFVSQTYVAVEPDGLDPCDVRIKKGDAAVRELVARREPLYRFVLGNVVRQFDLDRADGRVSAVREAAKLVTSSRDTAVATSSFAREISALTGMDPVDVQAEVARVSRGAARTATPQAAAPARGALPSLRDPRFSIERETLKLVVQHPMAIGRTTADIGANDFTHPTYRAVWELVAAAGGTVAGVDDPAWATRLRDLATEPEVSSAISALGVEPLLTAKEPDAGYVAHHVIRLLELTALRRIQEVKARLQRTNPVEQAGEYNKMFGELAALEQHRRTLRDRIAGEQ